MSDKKLNELTSLAASKVEGFYNAIHKALPGPFTTIELAAISTALLMVAHETAVTGGVDPSALIESMTRLIGLAEQPAPTAPSSKLN